MKNTKTEKTKSKYFDKFSVLILKLNKIIIKKMQEKLFLHLLQFNFNFLFILLNETRLSVIIYFWLFIIKLYWAATMHGLIKNTFFFCMLFPVINSLLKFIIIKSFNLLYYITLNILIKKKMVILEWRCASPEYTH